MKTILHFSQTLVLAMVLGLTATSVAHAQDKIYLGTRVPQMSTQERSNIGAEIHSQNARGQLIFNTDSAMLQYWNGDLWTPVKPADPQLPTVKQAIINVTDGAFDTEHLIFYGTTSIADNPLHVVSIEPVFSNLTMRRHFLRVESAVQVVNNAAEWSVSIENRNISPSNTCTLQSIIISYICDDAEVLSNATQSIIQVVGY